MDMSFDNQGEKGQLLSLVNEAKNTLTKKSRRKTRQDADELNLIVTHGSLLACFVCGKNFVSFGRLKSHEKTHSKSRPFKCIDCGKTFTVRYSLVCHTRVHTREKPYNCNVCGSRFSQASSLKTHQIYKHTKEFPYICKYCGRGFISPGQRQEHVNRTHIKGSKRRQDEEICSNPRTASASVQTNLSVPPDSIL